MVWASKVFRDCTPLRHLRRPTGSGPQPRNRAPRGAGQCRTFTLMTSQGRTAITFTLSGRRYELTRTDVESRLAGVAPDAIRKHAVRVNDIWFPAIQAFEVATGIPRSEFISHTARRHLAALGYEVAGDVEPRTSPPMDRASTASAADRSLDEASAAPAPIGEEWHTEANVQAFLVTALVSDGWRILSVANTATKEHGIDVIARDGQTVGVEVKGFPSRGYADPTRSGEVKPHEPEHAGWALVLPGRPRGDATARQGAGVAQRHRAARLPSLPRALRGDFGITRRSTDCCLVGEPRRDSAHVTRGRWYARPEGDGLVLRKSPRLASWNKATDHDQVQLRQYLEDTAELVAPALVSGPWAILLDVGLPVGRDLIDMADLDNYALPLASHLSTEHLVSVWCSKRHAQTSRVVVVPAQEVPAPEGTFTVRTTASSQTKAYQEQVRGAVVDAHEIPAGGVRLQIAFVAGPHRNWLSLWKPTIDALDPLLGRTRADRDWHPRDGRITDLGLHVDVDPSLGHDVLVTIAGDRATPA